MTDVDVAPSPNGQEAAAPEPIIINDSSSWDVAALANRGAEVQVAVLGDDGAVSVKSDGTPDEQTVWLRFDLNKLFLTEEMFGTVDDFIMAMAEKPGTNLRRVLSILTGWSEDECGRRVLPQHFIRVSRGVMIAYYMQIGMDPQQALRATRSPEASNANVAAVTPNFPGGSGGAPGPLPAGR